MDETTRTIIERITINCDKPMLLPDATECTVFYDCARLTPGDLARLAAQCSVQPEQAKALEDADYDLVVALAYSGILFGSAVAQGRPVSILQTDSRIWGHAVRNRKVLLVDDVIYTGSRMRDAERKVLLLGASVIGYCSIVNRSDGSLASNARPLWSAYHTSMI